MCVLIHGDHAHCHRFLEWVSDMDDVYVVSLDRVLAWVRSPVPLAEMNTLDAFQCPTYDPVTTCPDVEEYVFSPEDNLPNNLEELRMASCHRPKPEFYPWLYNPHGDLDIVPEP